MKDYDCDKIDEVVLALMQITLHDFSRAWKGFNWETLDHLYQKGWIEDPKGKTKSVVLTEKGLAKSTQLFQQYFGMPDKGAR